MGLHTTTESARRLKITIRFENVRPVSLEALLGGLGGVVAVYISYPETYSIYGLRA